MIPSIAVILNSIATVPKHLTVDFVAGKSYCNAVAKDEFVALEWQV
jgi:hypothetical protein